MLIVLSPAKTLDFESPSPALTPSQPAFVEHAQVLIERLRVLSPLELGGLMELSDKLAQLNVERNLAWVPKHTAANARPAMYAFNGDVYEGLDAATLDAPARDFAQQHLRMLSGLYGVLRPLDLIQPYRLEMGTRLDTARGANLYAFWGDVIADHLKAEMASPRVLVNLASEEYFKSVRVKRLEARVINPVFEDWKGGRYKVISFFAKRARGLMARYAIDHRLTEPDALRDFDREGYAFVPDASDADTWVFRRRQEGVA